MRTPVDFQKELKEMEAKMIASAKCAERLPVFAEKIMQEKLDGNEQWVKYADRYKDINLGWGVNRGFYENEGRRTITNHGGDYSGYYFNIYINSLSLFDVHNNFNLYESLEGVDIFFTDTSNTTFYVTDENIEAFLDALSEWHAKAKNEAWACRLRRSIKEAQEKIKTCEEQLKELGK